MITVGEALRAHWRNRALPLQGDTAPWRRDSQHPPAHHAARRHPGGPCGGVGAKVRGRRREMVLQDCVCSEYSGYSGWSEECNKKKKACGLHLLEIESRSLDLAGPEPGPLQGPQHTCPILQSPRSKASRGAALGSNMESQ